MNPRSWLPIRCIWIVLLLLGFHPTAEAATLVSCPNSGTGAGDLVSRGLYVTSYPGATLGTVTLAYTAIPAGSYTVSLTARNGAFDGPLIGSTQTVTAAIPSPGEVTVTFDFGNASLTPGSTVTFTQVLVSGPGSLFFDVGPCGLGNTTCTSCPGVVETEGTTPPLDSFRRGSVNVVITGTVAASTPTNTPTGTATNTPTSTPTGVATPVGVVVPTLSPWMLGLLALTLVMAALFLMKRN